MRKWKQWMGSLLAAGCLILSACSPYGSQSEIGLGTEAAQMEQDAVQYQETDDEGRVQGEIPPYSGLPYVEVNQNEPNFSEEEWTDHSFEEYGSLDELGRCQTAFASIGRDLMPAEDRGSISQIKPTGWHSVQYDIVEGESLYNRCHLIGYQLTGENANEENLITGTRYLNVDGMLPFENMVADYVKETGNHVLYRVTPVFEGDNLVASGVRMEGQSVEDGGEGICFHVYCYNVQPGVGIDYATGESWLEEDGKAEEETAVREKTYILNTNTHKFHRLTCSSVKQMDADNRKEYAGAREELLDQGYEPCGICEP